jgi:hypothetical protein
MIIPNIWKNKKCSKPPTSHYIVDSKFPIRTCQYLAIIPLVDRLYIPTTFTSEVHGVFMLNIRKKNTNLHGLDPVFLLSHDNVILIPHDNLLNLPSGNLT